MIISDLDHQENISEEIAKLDGGRGYAVAYANASAFAFGAFTIADTRTFAWASSLPRGGSIAIAFSRAFAVAYTPPMRTPSLSR